MGNYQQRQRNHAKDYTHCHTDFERLVVVTGVCRNGKPGILVVANHSRDKVDNSNQRANKFNNGIHWRRTIDGDDQKSNKQKR